jgi:hypothetical protein
MPPISESRILNPESSPCNFQFAIILFSLCLSIFSTNSLYAEAPIAVAVEGGPFAADISTIGTKGQITFLVAGQKRQVPLDDLVVWGACVEPKRAPILLLADSGVLSADVLSSDKETLSVDSEIFGRLKLPWDVLAGVIFRMPTAIKDRDAMFDRIAKAEGESDRLLLDNGDELTGLIEKISEDAARLTTNVGPVNVEMGRVTAIIFNPGLRRKISSNGDRIWLGLSDGSRLMASALQLDASSLQFVIAGQTWKAQSKQLVFLQPLSGRAVYLSDLKSSEYRFVPYLDLNWPYRPDRNVTGNFLRAGGLLYLKGIGMHSAARLSYAFDQSYNRFQSELAVDDSTDGGGSVRFRVFIDGQEKFTSDTIRGNMKPVPISVDITGAKQLDLIVDYADRADVLDHADWLNARLIKTGVGD